MLRPPKRGEPLGELPLPVIVAIAAAVGGAIGLIVSALVKRKPDQTTADAAVTAAEAQAQAQLNEGFAKLVASLSDQLIEARKEIADVRREAADGRKELLGEIENLTQHVYSLESILRQDGKPIPVRHRPQVITMVPKSP